MQRYRPGFEQPPATRVELGYYDLTTQLLAIEFERLGYSPVWILRDLFVVDVNGNQLPFWGTQVPITNHVSARIAKNKYAARLLLARSGVPVARGAHFGKDQVREAAEFATTLGGPAVIKPVGGRKGRSVAVGVRPGGQFDRAFASAARDPRGVIVEEQFMGGAEGRLFVVDGECHAVYGKRAPQVVGDGKSTITDLVKAKNAIRRANPHLRSRPLRLTEERLDRLRSMGYTEDSVVPPEEVVIIDTNANVSAGGESVDITDDVHYTYFDTAVAASHSLYSLEPAGVDVIATDFSRPATPDNHIVLEVNSSPALGAHHFPLVGESRNVAEAVVRASIKNASSRGHQALRLKRGLGRLTRKARR